MPNAKAGNASTPALNTQFKINFKYIVYVWCFLYPKKFESNTYWGALLFGQGPTGL